ncbi:protoporphyrinogen oxidase [Pseudonocardia aurantiaca]|uniref:Coproporphyrinogen III oxidase n=1 Tax=Pseudonocardia aurantiaca TaxID=75290 RepID=A0ABW4FFP5_9PSEU
MTAGPTVAVVGGGISGLAAAHRLRALLGPRAELTVLEQRERIGGVLHTVDLAGVPFDVGAEAFLVRRPEVPALLAELGLTEQLVHPGPAAASVRANRRTGPLPAGTLLGVPTSAARLDGLLSDAGLATVAAEPEQPLQWQPGGDVALGGLLRARFGDELADRLADPLLGGVYAGRVDALGLRATVPALAAALDAGASSLTAAADAATPPAPASRAPGPVFGAVRGGYQVLLDALAAAARTDLRLGTTVRELARREAGWRLTLGPTTAPEALDVDAVVLAVPAPAAARLLVGVAPAAARAAGDVELASSVVVALAFRPQDAAGLPSTSGVLVAADEPLSVKAVTHSTTKWSHLAPDGLVRLRASLGRFGEAATLQADDAALTARVRADLATLAGITAAPVAVHVQRWGGGLPQYGVGHLDRVHTIEHGLPAGLAVAGSALHGVGVPACVATGRAAAERVAAGLRSGPS